LFLPASILITCRPDFLSKHTPHEQNFYYFFDQFPGALIIAHTKSSDLVEQSSAGVWKAQIGKPQRFDLLHAANIHPQKEALQSLGEADFPLLKADCFAQLQQGKIYLRFPLDKDEQLFGLGLNFQTVNQRGRILNLHMDHYGGTDNGRTHAAGSILCIQ
jgi:hypothetical protein